jgi:cell division septum initiation protein DivIVA
VTDSRMKDRMKGLLAGPPPTGESPDQADVPSDSSTPRHALQVLTLAQRTADEHVAGARREAEKIQADAKASAEQIARDAEAHANKLRREANKVLSDAREAAARTDRDAQARTDDARRDADQILFDAQAKAETVAAAAQANAEELKLQAEQRYQDVVGGLAGKREALQRQIEALEQFDREYRTRLVSFMQGQLRALWVDEPQVAGEIEQPVAGATNGSGPAQRPASAAVTESSYPLALQHQALPGSNS